MKVWDRREGANVAGLIRAGDQFPDFNLPNENGAAMRRADFAGQWLVVFVYPKDDTPGCTVESKGFSTTKLDFEAIGAQVVGLSADDPASHKSFCGKYGLTVTLLADPSGTLLGALGLGQTEYGGTRYWDRTTFVVDPGGVVRKVYTNVKPQGHEREVLADLKRLQASAA
jgi:peroxiredoxin Q/BCP